MKRKTTMLSLLLIGLVALGGLPLLHGLQFSKSQTVTQPQTANELWDFTSNLNYASPVYYSPVIANGLVYVNSASVGSGPTSLYCINASTGAIVWARTNTYIDFRLANGYVYVNENNGSYSEVACLNPFNGSQIWTQIWKSSYPSSVTPFVVGKYVFVTGCNYTVSASTSTSVVYALDAFTGKQLWNSTGNPGDSVAVVDDYVYFAYTHVGVLSRGVFAFNASTGEKIWSYSTQDSLLENQYAPVVADGKVFVSYNDYNVSNANFHVGGVYVLDALNGTLIWDHKSPSYISSPTVDNGICYVETSDGLVNAYNASNGNYVWNLVVGSNLGEVHQGSNHLLLLGSRLYVGVSSGVCCFDAVNGNLVWNFTAPDYTDSYGATYPVYSNGVVYVGWNGPIGFASSIDHNFYAINAFTGEELWNYTLGYTVVYSPTVSSNVVYVGASWTTTGASNTQSPGAVIALNSTITPSSSIPEFPTWIILPFLIAAATAALAYAKKKKAKTTKQSLIRFCPSSQP